MRARAPLSRCARFLLVALAESPVVICLGEVMATCPKCQLPNPEAIDVCIWCGRHCFVDSAVVVDQVPAVSSPVESPAAIALLAPAPLVSSMQTTSSLLADRKPLPAHVNLLLSSEG